jgi:peptide/nickel transport system substrate-binding protein
MKNDIGLPLLRADEMRLGRMDRRTFMGGLSLLGLSAAAGSTFPMPARAEETPKPGGHLRFAMAHGEAADTLDPAHVNNGYVTVVAYAITNMLTEVGTDGALEPKLAESWEASEGATKWTFKLRKGVEFHNGKSFTAKDVVASINHHRGEKSTSSVKPIVDPMTSVEADGDHVVVIRLKSGDADIPFKLSTFSFGMYPRKDDGTIDWQSGIGTGAYRLKSFRPGERTELEKNRNFWQAGRGHFDSGELLTIQGHGGAPERALDQ